VQAAREAARRNSCAHNVREQTTALQNYHSQQMRFPPGGILHQQEHQPAISWRVLILPFIEEYALYDSIGPSLTTGGGDWALESEMPELYHCPSTEPALVGVSANQISSYWGVAGAAVQGQGRDLIDVPCGDLHENGVLFPGSRIKTVHIVDGTSHTLAIGERTYSFRGWMTGSTWSGMPPTTICSAAANHVRYPINASHDQWGYFYGHNPLPSGGVRSMSLNDLPFGSAHQVGAHFGLADGSVHLIANEIDFTVYQALATITGGEVAQWQP
jgi:hypothetical protein